MNAEHREALEGIVTQQSLLRDQLWELDRKVGKLVGALSPEPEAETERPPAAMISKPALPAREPAVAEVIPEREKPVPELEGAKGTQPAVKVVAEKGDAGSADAEMHLGRVWLVRAGVVMLLAGLVFAAEFARSHWWTFLPAVAKLGTFYLASFGMLGIGLWLERRREDTRVFGRVLAAGGAAAVYYTTYAAHYIERLQIIASPAVATLCLIAWAVALVVFSEKRNSQGIAVAGVLLAFFTCVLGDVTPFARWAALILTAGGAALLLRSRGWVVVGFVSLAASYLCFAYWRIPSMIAWAAGAAPEPNWFLGAYSFLVGYWIVFSIAGLWPKSPLTPPVRSSFVSANNAAFLTLFSLGIACHVPDLLGEFWLLSGAVLLALGLLSRCWLGDDKVTPSLCAAVGSLVFTAGLFAQFDGAGLALSLALEGSVLASASRLMPGWRHILAIPSVVLGFIALAVALETGAPAALLLGQTALWLLAMGMIRARGEGDPEVEEICDYLRIGCGVLAAIAYIGFVIALELTGGWASVMVFAGAVVGYSLGCSMKGLRELKLGAPVFGLSAGLWALFAFYNLAEYDLRPGALVLTILLCGFVVAAKVTDRQSRPVSGIYAVLCALFTLTLLFEAEPSQTAIVLCPSVLAAAWYGVAMLLRLPQLARAMAFLHLFGMLALCMLTLSMRELSGAAVFAYTALLGGVAAMMLRFPLGSSEKWRIALPVMAGFSAFVGFLLWSGVYFDPLASAYLRFAAAVVGIWFGVSSTRRWAAFAGLAVMSFGTYDWFVGFEAAMVPLIAVVIWAGLLVPRAFGRDGSDREAEWIFAIYAVVMAFFAATRLAGDLPLALSWAVVGGLVFALGFVLSARPYRVLALCILGLATGHVLAIDVWKLETLGRIVSFASVGAVLVILGFFYNRFSERLASRG